MTNDKEKSMYRIVETVARCCATETCGETFAAWLMYKRNLQKTEKHDKRNTRK